MLIMFDLDGLTSNQIAESAGITCDMSVCTGAAGQTTFLYLVLARLILQLILLNSQPYEIASYKIMQLRY